MEKIKRITFGKKMSVSSVKKGAILGQAKNSIVAAQKQRNKFENARADANLEE